jgi:hypothetical protein
MPSYTDAHGRAWSVEITVATLKRVRALAGVDLLEAAGGSLLDRLVADPVLLADVLYAVVKPQADERKLTDEDVGRGLTGDAIDHATSALLDAFVAFFPSPRRRILETALAKLAGWRQQALQAAQARLDDPALDAAVTAALARMPAPPGASSGNAPVSVGSIPPG